MVSFLLVPLGHLGPETLFLLPELRRERLAEILRLEDLANLDLGVVAVGVVDQAERGPLDPFDRLFLRLHLPDPEPRDQLLGLGERAIDHGPLRSGDPYADALRARLQSLA